MGVHIDIENELIDLLQAGSGLGHIPILNALAVNEDTLERYPAAILLYRERIDYQPHLPINPDQSSTQQPETWTWIVGVKGGGGAARLDQRGREVDKVMENVRTALGAHKMTNCGPLHLVSEEYAGESGTGVVYHMTWTHSRF